MFMMEPKERSPTRETTEVRRRNSLPTDDSGHELQNKLLGIPPCEQGQMLDCEKDFMEFLLTLPAEPPTTSKSLERTRKLSKSPKTKPKVGLDHLDNLCKLMEQLGDLKEQNHKLLRRVQYLEDMKDLHDMQKLLDPEYGLEERRASHRTPSPGGGSATQELGVLDDGVHKSSTQVVLRSRGRCRSRERSKSVGTQDDYADSRSMKSKRFPNWSKVKEALGLERSAAECEGPSKGILVRTSPSDGVFMQDEGLGVPTTERWPAHWDADSSDLPPQSCSWSEESFPGRLHGEVLGAGSMAHGNLRPGEPVRRKSSPISPSGVRDTCKKTVLDSKCHCHLDSDSLYPDVGDSYGSRELCKKVPKSTWGRVKNLIQTGRETVKRQPPSRTAKHGALPTQPRTDLRVGSDLTNSGAPSDPEDSSTSRGREVRRRKVSDQLGSSSRNSRASDDLQFLPTEHSKSQSHIQCIANHLEVDSETNRKLRLQQQVSCPSEHEVSKLTLAASERCNVPSPQSPQSQRKSRWNRVKKVFSGATQDKKEDEPPGASNPSSPLSTTLVFDFDDLGAGEGERSAPRRSEDASEPSLSNAASLCHSSTAPVSNLVQELQRNLSEDFNQKILEWERMKAAKSGRSPRPLRKLSAPHRPAVAASKGTPRDKTKGPRPDKKKDLTWVNRELQKMEREKERLSRETHKFQERSVRLHRLRQALLNAPASSNEVLVRTSAGEFRFEGISNAFTKKLYEWETKKGVVPEFSTIALLDASLQTTGRNGDKSATSNVRVLSKSDSSVAEPNNILQSRASTSSLPSMKPDTLLVPEEKKEISRSRANSEPELCSSSNKNGCAASRPRTVSVGSGEASFAHPGVTWLIDSGSGEIDDQFDSKPSQGASETKHAEESYYTLLEENMLLLEQLRAKENVCARLEANLERLDERLELMASRHREEIERYRESLWNAHRPAGAQKGSLASVKAVADFRYRLEDLERCNYRLQEERKALQETIRTHSQEQAALIWDIVDKVKELQALNTDIHNSDADGRRTSLMRLDADGLARIQQLSEQLLQSAQLLEAAVAERSSQVCQLRRELLMCELASAGRGAIKPPRSLRTLRSASDGVLGAVRSLHSDEGTSKSGLRISSTSPAVERGPGPSVQLMETVHKLRSELLRLFASHGISSALGEAHTDTAASLGSSMHQMADSTDISRRPNGFRENARHSLASSSESPSHRSAPEALASGHDGSESSSINDSEHVALGLRLPRSCLARARDTLSTSSDSSCLEDDSFTRMALSGGGARRLGESHDWRHLERDHELDRRVSCCGDYEDDVFNDPSSTSSLEVAYNFTWKSHDRRGPSTTHKDKSNTTDLQTRLSEDLAPSFPQQKVRSHSSTGCNDRNETVEMKDGCLSNSPHHISLCLSDHDRAKTDRGSLSDATEKNYDSACMSKVSRRYRKEHTFTDHERDPSDLRIPQEPCHSETPRSQKSSGSTSSSLPSPSWDSSHKSSLTSSRHGQSSYYIPHTSMAVPVALPRSTQELASSRQEVTAFLSATDSSPSPCHDSTAANLNVLLEQNQRLEFSREDATTQHRKSRQESTEKSFLSLRLRRPKKKDYSAIGQLCRQTLPLSVSDDTESPPEALNAVLERSSSSPVTARSRSFSRTKWLPLFVTKS